MYQSVAPLVGVGTHLTVNSFMDEKLVAGHNSIQLILLQFLAIRCGSQSVGLSLDYRVPRYSLPKVKKPVPYCL